MDAKPSPSPFSASRPLPALPPRLVEKSHIRNRCKQIRTTRTHGLKMHQTSYLTPSPLNRYPTPPARPSCAPVEFSGGGVENLPTHLLKISKNSRFWALFFCNFRKCKKIYVLAAQKHILTVFSNVKIQNFPCGLKK